MIIANIFALILCALNSGFRQVNFLETTVKKRSVVIPVLSNDFCHAHSWNSFINDRPLSSAWWRSSDGTENALVLSRQSMSIRGFNSNKVFFEYFSGLSKVNGMRDFRIDKDGNFYLYIPRGDKSVIQRRIASDVNKIDWQYDFKGGISGFGTLQDWSKGNTSSFLYAVSPLGEMTLIDLVNDKTGKDAVSIPLPIGSGSISGVYSDGKSNDEGVFEIFLWGNFSGGNTIIKCEVKPSDLNVKTVPISVVVTGSPSGFEEGKLPTTSSIADLIQFWVSDNDWRLILRMRNNNIVIANKDGQVIEAPVVSSINGGLNNALPLKVGDIHSMSTCNNRSSWRYCSDILLFEDFSKTGQGVRKMQWVPDGYIYNLPVEVWMKEVSTEPNISKPLIMVKNKSTWKSAKNLTLRLWHSKAEQETQSTVSDLYYTAIPGVTISDGYSNDNPNITYTDVVLPDDFELEPGESSIADGIQIGIHFAGYYPGVWDKSNDWSWVNPSSLSYQLNPNAGVYTRDEEGRLGKIFGNDPPPNFVRRPNVVSERDIFGFEDVMFWSYALELSLSEKRSEGVSGLKIPVSGYHVLTSMPFALNDEKVSSIAFDLYVDEVQPNPYWAGDLQVFITSRSSGVHNSFLGNISMTNHPKGIFKECKLSIPEWVSAGLQSRPKDVQISISVNGANPGSPIVLDNLRIE